MYESLRYSDDSSDSESEVDSVKQNTDWYNDETLYNEFITIYQDLFMLPIYNNIEITNLSQLSDTFIDNILKFSNYDITDAIKKYDLSICEGNIKNYTNRITTMKEFFLFILIRNSIQIKSKEDYTCLNKIITSDNNPIRLSSLIGITYLKNKIYLGKRFPFLCEQTRERYRSCAFMMKIIGNLGLLFIDFDEYYFEEKLLKSYDISKLFKDLNGIAYYSYKKKKTTNQGEVIMYNRIMGILSFLKFLTGSKVFKLKNTK